MKTLGIIPARAGSTRLKNKNMMKIHGKPLIYWTIRAALDSDLDKVLVSSNDYNIIQYAASMGAVSDVTQESGEQKGRFFYKVRPEFLSRNNTPIFNVIYTIAENFRNIDYERYMLLNPTSPLRTKDDINAVLNYGDHSVVSVCRNPGFWWKGGKRQYSIPRRRTQDITQRYQENGAIFMLDRYVLAQGEIVPKNEKNTALYEMPKERSLDIDDYYDFILCERMMKEIVKK